MKTTAKTAAYDSGLADRRFAASSNNEEAAMKNKRMTMLGARPVV